MDVLKHIIQKSKEFMTKNSFGGHDYGHIMRVYLLSKFLGEKENADMLVLEAAAIMHDLGRHKETIDPSKDHAIESEKIAANILNDLNFPKEKKDEVLYCIRSHRFSKGIIPETKEAKILQDADRIDALGAIGIMRCFYYGGVHNRLPYDLDDPFCKHKNRLNDEKYSIDHFYKKLFRLRETLHMESARKIALDREKYMHNFLLRLEKEINGTI